MAFRDEHIKHAAREILKGEHESSDLFFVLEGNKTTIKPVEEMEFSAGMRGHVSLPPLVFEVVLTTIAEEDDDESEITEELSWEQVELSSDLGQIEEDQEAVYLVFMPAAGGRGHTKHHLLMSYDEVVDLLQEWGV